MPERLLFLPGAAGRLELWTPVAQRLVHPAARVHVGWPGFGPTPPDPQVRGLDDLVARVVGQLDRPTALLAQSMGGVVAVLAALQRPERVTHLVLSVTSGGLDLAALGAVDWRPEFLATQPTLPRWFADATLDLSARLPALDVPTLLLWGDRDPISPVAVGRRLATLLPRATLQVIAGGDHDLVRTHAAAVAPLIDAHLAADLRAETAA